LKVRPTIEHVIDRWLADHRRTSIPLAIAHSHTHGDHHQGDAEFVGRPEIVIVGLYRTEVSGFFGITDWPNQIVQYDLGKRKLDVIPIPGHQVSHLTLYDEHTRLLLSGDALCPCHVYFPTNQFASYRESIDRVVTFI
jgi:hydroxyacylglutathione hydrolase